jgi:hypothetical protein
MVVITAITIISDGPDSIGYAKQSILTSFIFKYQHDVYYPSHQDNKENLILEL